MSEVEAIDVDTPAEEQVDAGVPAAAGPVESSKRERKKSVDVYKVEVKEHVEFVIKQVCVYSPARLGLVPCAALG